MSNTLIRRCRQLLCGICAIATAWTPWAVIWADDMRDAAAMGQNFGSAQGSAYAAPTADANSVNVPGGGIQMQQLFPDSDREPTSVFTDRYGEDAGTRARGEQAQSDLLSEDSGHGNAYSALRQGFAQDKPSLTNDDTLWHQTTEVEDNLQTLSEHFADCSIDSTFSTSTRTPHIPAYETCERIPDYNVSCTLVHDFAFPQAYVPVQPDGFGATSRSIEEELEIATNSYQLVEQWEQMHDQFCPFGTPFGSMTGIDYCNMPVELLIIKTNFEKTQALASMLTSGGNHGLVIKSTGCSLGDFNFNVDKPENVMSVWADITGTAPGRPWVFKITEGLPANRIYDQRYGELRDDLVADGRIDLWDYSNPMWHIIDWSTGQIIGTYDIRNSQNFCARASVYISYKPVDKPTYDVWSGGPCAQQAQFARNNPFCSYTQQCTEQTSIAGNCYTDVGVEICTNDLAAAPVSGISAWCRRATVEAHCDDFNVGAMDCWVDAQGTTRCPENAGNNRNECQTYEDNPNCGWVKTECVKGAAADGKCFVYEDTYDCGGNGLIPIVQRETELDCVGPVRCVGRECLDLADEQSQDFSRAAAALQIAQFAWSDHNCQVDAEGNVNPVTCRIFRGEGNQCKKAVGGIVNCCTRPDGVSLTEYITLIFAVAKLDKAVMGLGETNALRGTWELLRTPIENGAGAVNEAVTSVWETVKQPFTSVANSITGSTAAAATDVAAETASYGIKQTLVRQTAQWVANTFGEQAANMVFASTTGGPAVSGGSLASEAIGLGGPIGAVLGWVMTAYMIYQVAMILIQMLYECEEEEFELGAKRELRACHYVGTYCDSDFLGVCIERKQSYCCYNTPLARIVNEQAYPQLGRPWGEPDAPDCRGLSIAEIQSLDWSQINLDEWLSILMETGRFPDAADIDIESLTGQGARTSTGTRINVAERTASRTAGIDGQAIHEAAEEELTGETKAAVP